MDKIIVYIDTDNENMLYECRWWSSRERLGFENKDCPYEYPHGLINKSDL